jgi:hypothetical protein
MCIKRPWYYDSKLHIHVSVDNENSQALKTLGLIVILHTSFVPQFYTYYFSSIKGRV